MWLIDLFNSNDMDRKSIYVCIHTNFSPFIRLLFISITENERMSKQHVNEGIPCISVSFIRNNFGNCLWFLSYQMHFQINLLQSNITDISNILSK